MPLSHLFDSHYFYFTFDEMCRRLIVLGIRGFLKNKKIKNHPTQSQSQSYEYQSTVKIQSIVRGVQLRSKLFKSPYLRRTYEVLLRLTRSQNEKKNDLLIDCQRRKGRANVTYKIFDVRTEGDETGEREIEGEENVLNRGRERSRERGRGARHGEVIEVENSRERGSGRGSGGGGGRDGRRSQNDGILDNDGRQRTRDNYNVVKRKGKDGDNNRNNYSEYYDNGNNTDQNYFENNDNNENNHENEPIQLEYDYDGTNKTSTYPVNDSIILFHGILNKNKNENFTLPSIPIRWYAEITFKITDFKNSDFEKKDFKNKDFKNTDFERRNGNGDETERVQKRSKIGLFKIKNSTDIHENKNSEKRILINSTLNSTTIRSTVRFPFSTEKFSELFVSSQISNLSLCESVEIKVFILDLNLSVGPLGTGMGMGVNNNERNNNNSNNNNNRNNRNNRDDRNEDEDEEEDNTNDEDDDGLNFENYNNDNNTNKRMKNNKNKNSNYNKNNSEAQTLDPAFQGKIVISEGENIITLIGGRMHFILHPNHVRLNKLYLPNPLTLALRTVQNLYVTATIMPLSVPSSKYLRMLSTCSPVLTHPSVFVSGESMVEKQVSVCVSECVCVSVCVSE